MEATQPRLDEPKSVNRKRWWVHLVLITSYLLVVALLSMMRNKPNHPALSHTATGLLIVCGAELLLFGIIFAAAWAAARASRDDLRLRWRGKGMPVLLGLGYSVSLRIAVGVLTFFEPGITALALGFLVAGWAIATGIFEVAAAFRMRKDVPGEILFFVTGLLSIALGVILAIHPFTGLLAAVYLIGAYAILAGVVLTALAFRLRARRSHDTAAVGYPPHPSSRVGRGAGPR